MGWVNEHILQNPGKHLLNVLKKEGSVRYSRFYGDDDNIQQELCKAIRALSDDPDDEDDDLEEHAHVLLEFAAGQMKDKGLLSFTHLSEKLIDEEPDFLITLTDKGKEFIASGQEFKHWDMDL